MLTCKQCGIEKALDQFYKSKTCKGGYRAVCKSCVAKESKAYREANAEAVKARKDKYRAERKDRVSESNRNYYASKLEENRAKRRDYYQRNKEKMKATATAWNKANKERRLEIHRASKARNPETVKAEYERNKDQYFERAAKRRVTCKQATPAWTDEKKVRDLYRLTQIMNEVYGPRYFHVDHVVPLTSKKVCGLHAHTNLRITKAAENLAKRNRYWPDMPEKI